MPRKKTQQEFIRDLRKINPAVEVLGNYTKSSVPVTCRCKTCGYQWKPTPNNLLSGFGCPICGIKKRADSRRKTTKSFIKEMEKVDPTIEIIGEYTGAQRPIDCRCKVCGHEWSPLATNLLGHKGCPICRYSKTAEKLTPSNEMFLSKLKKVNPNVQVNESYKKSSEKISCTCTVCGYSWLPTPSSLLQGVGCPRCAGNERYTQETFLQKVKEKCPAIEILGPYVRSASPILCKCKVCGHIWNSRPNNILTGHGCPNCNHSTTSFFEQAIYGAFCCALGEDEIVQHDRKQIGYELDIFIPALNIAIEPGSWHWHNRLLDRDTKKRTLCANKEIRLITVYSDFNDDQIPFDNDCIVSQLTFGLDNEYEELKSLIHELFRMCTITASFSANQWTQIMNKAYLNSRRKSTKKFIEELKLILPKVTITDEYKGALHSIACKCNICGYKWETTPHSLLSGHGCPRCAAKERGIRSRKSPEVFEKELQEINSKIILLEKYHLSNQKIKCKCAICGHEWKALPNNLLNGRGCPKCARHRKDYIKL